MSFENLSKLTIQDIKDNPGRFLAEVTATSRGLKSNDANNLPDAKIFMGLQEGKIKELVDKSTYDELAAVYRGMDQYKIRLDDEEKAKKTTTSQNEGTGIEVYIRSPAEHDVIIGLIETAMAKELIQRPEIKSQINHIMDEMEFLREHPESSIKAGFGVLFIPAVGWKQNLENSDDPYKQFLGSQNVNRWVVKAALQRAANGDDVVDRAALTDALKEQRMKELAPFTDVDTSSAISHPEKYAKSLLAAMERSVQLALPTGGKKETELERAVDAAIRRRFMGEGASISDRSSAGIINYPPFLETFEQEGFGYKQALAGYNALVKEAEHRKGEGNVLAEDAAWGAVRLWRESTYAAFPGLRTQVKRYPQEEGLFVRVLEDAIKYEDTGKWPNIGSGEDRGIV